MPKPILQYLFTAYFLDGSLYEQSPDDVSINDPTKSCFYDVLQKDITKVTKFALSNTENRFEVDLTTGIFTKNGIPQKMPDFEVFSPRKLIYFMNVRQSLVLQPATFINPLFEAKTKSKLLIMNRLNDTHSFPLDSRLEKSVEDGNKVWRVWPSVSEKRKYCFGFEAHDETGKNKQLIISLE